MPMIHFMKKNRASIFCEVGEILMKALLKNQVPVASSCNGEGVCAKCRVKISTGDKKLSLANAAEKQILSKTPGGSEDRLSCQARVVGDITVDTAYW